MAEFNPAETRSGMDYLVLHGTQYYDAGGKESGLWMMEAVNQTWCALSPGQKKQVMDVESPHTTFATGPNDRLGILEKEHGQNFVPLNCSPNRDLANEFVQGKFELVPEKRNTTTKREQEREKILNYAQQSMNMIIWNQIAQGNL